MNAPCLRAQRVVYCTALSATFAVAAAGFAQTPPTPPAPPARAPVPAPRATPARPGVPPTPVATPWPAIAPIRPDELTGAMSRLRGDLELQARAMRDEALTLSTSAMQFSREALGASELAGLSALRGLNESLRALGAPPDVMSWPSELRESLRGGLTGITTAGIATVPPDDGIFREGLKIGVPSGDVPRADQSPVRPGSRREVGGTRGQPHGIPLSRAHVWDIDGVRADGGRHRPEEDDEQLKPAYRGTAEAGEKRSAGGGFCFHLRVQVLGLTSRLTGRGVCGKARGCQREILQEKHLGGRGRAGDALESRADAAKSWVMRATPGRDCLCKMDDPNAGPS